MDIRVEHFHFSFKILQNFGPIIIIRKTSTSIINWVICFNEETFCVFVLTNIYGYID